jgi:hypothetical protein
VYSPGNVGHLPQKVQQAQHMIKRPDIDIDNVVVVVIVVMMCVVVVGMAVMVSVVVVMCIVVAVSVVLILSDIVDGAVVEYKLRGRHD